MTIIFKDQYHYNLVAFVVEQSARLTSCYHIVRLAGFYDTNPTTTRFKIMATPEDEEATISLPSLAFVAVLGFIIYRYFTYSSRAASPSTGRVAGQRFTPAQVEQITSMFPQLNRRDIMWDLQRNGGSVAATTERILGGSGLAPVCMPLLGDGVLLTDSQAPPSFQPVMPNLPTTSNTNTFSIPKPTKPEQDLISRYNLHSRIGASDKGKEKEENGPSGWAGTKDQRQQVLQRRRDEMILAARRRMLEKDAEGGSQGPIS